MYWHSAKIFIFTIYKNKPITEDDGLIDLQFSEQCVEAMHFLFLLNVSVELADSLQSKLLHKVDLVGIVHVSVENLQLQLLLLQQDLKQTVMIVNKMCKNKV